MNNTGIHDVFRTLLYDCRWLIPPLLNTLFGTHYSGKEKIELIPNRFLWNSEAGEEKRNTDFCFITDKNGITERYHIECSIDQKGRVLAKVCLIEAKTGDGNFFVSVPRSAVIALREKTEMPEAMQLFFRMPMGSIRQTLPVLRLSDYSLHELLENKLLLLLPFYLFSHESEFHRLDNSASDLAELLDSYLCVQDELEESIQLGSLDRFTDRAILFGIVRAAECLSGDYDNIVEGMRNLMGGEILDYEEKEILEKGRMDAIRELTMNLYREGVALTKLAAAANLDIAVLKEWIAEA